MKDKERDKQPPVEGSTDAPSSSPYAKRTELTRVECECGQKITFGADELQSQIHQCPHCGEAIGVPGREELHIATCKECNVIIRCGHWQLGETCPQCGSRNVFPVTVVSGAVDYALADRSGGYAIEDIRFARLAKWLGLIHQKQYERSLERQMRAARSGRLAPDIGQVMVDNRLLTDEQMCCILQVLAAVRPDKSDMEFGEYAQERGFIADEAYQAALRQQGEIEKQVNNVPALPYLLLEKNAMREAQVLGILRFQRKRETGLLAEYDHAMRQLHPPKVRRTLPKRQVVCVGILVLLAAFWTHKITRAIYAPKSWVPLGCKRCWNMDIWEVPQGRRFPMLCPWCNRRSAYLVFECRHCRRVRFERDLYDTSLCPYCNKARLKRMLHRRDPDSGEWYMTRLKADQAH